MQWLAVALIRAAFAGYYAATLPDPENIAIIYFTNETILILCA
jgi:hypothetical protein